MLASQATIFFKEKIDMSFKSIKRSSKCTLSLVPFLNNSKKLDPPRCILPFSFHFIRGPPFILFRRCDSSANAHLFQLAPFFFFLPTP